MPATRLIRWLNRRAGGLPNPATSGPRVNKPPVMQPGAVHSPSGAMGSAVAIRVIRGGPGGSTADEAAEARKCRASSCSNMAVLRKLRIALGEKNPGHDLRDRGFVISPG